VLSAREEPGIEVTKNPRIGWSPTDLSQTTREDHADTIAVLGQALRLYRAAEMTGSQAVKPTNPAACVCSCRRRIRVAVSGLAAGPDHLRTVRHRLPAGPVKTARDAGQLRGDSAPHD
jgi:hypothetical protein